MLPDAMLLTVLARSTRNWRRYGENTHAFTFELDSPPVRGLSAAIESYRTTTGRYEDVEERLPSQS